MQIWGSLWKRFSRGELSTGSGNDIGAECCLRGTGRGIGDMIIAPVGGLGSDLKIVCSYRKFTKEFEKFNSRLLVDCFFSGKFRFLG